MPNRRTLRVLGALTLLGAVLGAGGCFFEPRTPEEGIGEVCYEAVPSTEDRFVFANLDGSMECLQAFSYLDQLSEDFVFVPSPGVQSQFPGVFTGPESWTKTQEEQFLDRLFSDAQSVESQLLETVIDKSGTQEVLFEASYRVRVIGRDGSDITYTGEAFYTVRQEATTWFLVRWEEQASDNPLGQLRGGLLQGG